ncbi:glycoside hydrolase family 88 protein [Pedobacter heparinus]|uniref:Glycosyl hydrolase family 88 n=1 Tax=Pedobacter heparinus (strain ATCC 13125 / DSM 2366 / CIP 104194 / JCM 7457 / NBRC 12017 / NCIMB 9290 / NRRL B-14731 / HIM 762-3) TaxID=485917 RepID=C6Y0D8_PEDHD|nr:glycoside hydrolase family 88 protein [Pedobacter heparinus]ACU04850.1 glycosyl hydrolase family 88 [Pedobacter heparinus DSM 2366]
MNIIKSSPLFILLTILSCKSQTDSVARLTKSEQQLTELRILSMKQHKNPRSINAKGQVRWTESPYDWTEGFWPGTCWMLYENTKDEQWKEAAIATQHLFEQHKLLTNDHDLGFIFNNSFGKAYRITGDTRYKQVLIDAAKSLSTRFNKNVGCIKSWDVIGNWQAKRGWKFPVIIDNLMNLEMLFEVSDITGDSMYRAIAIAHANTTMRNHFRPDGSSYHVLDYNPETGELVSKVTAQGFADESAWARGQAWGLYAYTMCYRYTKDKKYLDFAEKIANFILNHPNYPQDGVPYWDFNAPTIPDAPRDASSAAIIASALLELNRYTGDKYINNAQRILNSLASDAYTAKKGENAHFVLMHSVGSLPHGNEIDVPLNYTDYYYLEALSRLKERGL